MGDVKMKVYALVGKSGTGKSFQALNLCKEKSIPAIIDDGLFIYNNRIAAGTSAKKSNNIISAVKVAIFTDEEHRRTVRDKVKEYDPPSILVIGTSDRMIGKIVDALEFPEVEETIYIEDITSPEEREMAKYQRYDMGKHVIPVPTFQIKKEFSGYFMDPMKIWKDFGWRKGRTSYSEKSVVRPTYSYFGKYMISEKVISDIIENVIIRQESAGRLLKTVTDQKENGVEITCIVTMKKGFNVVDSSLLLQADICNAVEEMTAFNVNKLDIEVRALD